MLVVPQSPSLMLKVMMFYLETSSPHPHVVNSSPFFKSWLQHQLLQKTFPDCPGWPASILWASILSGVCLSPGN